MLKPRRCIIKAILPDWANMAESSKAEVYADCLIYIDKALQQAPAHIRFVIGTLDWLFAIFYAGFSIAKPNGIQTTLRLWSGLASVTMTHIRFYRSLTMLVFCEHPLISAGHRDALQHQQEYRQRRAAALATDGDVV